MGLAGLRSASWGVAAEQRGISRKESTHRPKRSIGFGNESESLDALNSALSALKLTATEEKSANYRTLWREWPVVIGLMAMFGASWGMRKFRNMPQHAVTGWRAADPGSPPLAAKHSFSEQRCVPKPSASERGGNRPKAEIKRPKGAAAASGTSRRSRAGAGMRAPAPLQKRVRQSRPIGGRSSPV